MSFSEHVITRQLQLYEEYNKQFTNIYKERVSMYFQQPCDSITALKDAAKLKSNASHEDVEMAESGDQLCAGTYDGRKDNIADSMMIIQE